MKQLKRVSLVQFFLHEAFDIEVEGSIAFLGQNGSGKSSTLDAIQIAMLGGNQQYLRFNTQSVSSKQRRNIASYCLGILRDPEKDSAVAGRARDEARTYIILVFGDGTEGGSLSAGICVEADIESDQHEVKGLFILPGQRLNSNDCIIYDGNDRRPMPFADFRENARTRAQQIGRTAIFTDKSSDYVSELLYALNGERMPNPRQFMSSFVKSMTLKNVDSIDHFVRDYVVEANPIDVAAFRKQVEQFVALRDLIQRTKARISRLTGILGHFERAKTAERRIAALQAISALFKVEWQGEQIDTLTDQIQILEEQRESALEYAGQARNQRDIKSNEVSNLRVRLEMDQNEQRRLHLDEQIQSWEKVLDAYDSPAMSRGNRLINSLRDLIEDGDFACVRRAMKSALDTLINARSSERRGAEVARALRELEGSLSLIQSTANTSVAVAVNARSELVEEYEATRRRIAAAAQTGRLLNDGAARLLEMLDRAGMRAQPVSALAKIIDPDWAPALEGYLGNDRDALVVTEGNTRDAVKILREARRAKIGIDGAAVVQPNHLRNVDTAAKAAAFAVGLLETQNDTARRFLWQKFGNMRLVDTEADLETHPRAITRDGMLSQGGLTKSIRVAPFSDLRVGNDVEDTSELSRHAAALQSQLNQLNKRIVRLEALTKALSDDVSNGDEDESARTEAVNALARAKHELATLDVAHLVDIRAALASAQDEYNRLDEETTKNNNLASGLGQQVQERSADKTRLESQLVALREAEKAAVENPLVDLGLVDRLKDEIERSAVHYEQRLTEVDSKLSKELSKQRLAEERGSLDLSNYVQDERLDVQVSDMHWYDRLAWTVDERRKLSDTHLQRYETEAEQARLASEETLRSDIAMSLHDRFKEMEIERRERNKILDSCPPFTGGERYRFTATVVPAYESLVRYINQIAHNDQNLPLDSNNLDEINEALRGLVEAAAESGNAGAVLDYRQFYTFDLDIMVDGKRVDRMSNRQGAGSNGEHIAPMYVAAGAALAKAYRLHKRSKSGHNNTGLICLDEAFHGMDTTNAVATARFLQNLGLQLIMAGPELELTKLAPITQTIYDLDREGLDLQMERTLFKPAANALMVSDMPGENPQVMEDAYRQLGFELPPQPSLVEQEYGDE